MSLTTFTIFPFIARFTVARDVIDAVVTGAIVLTRRRGAVIDVLLAIAASVAIVTATYVRIDVISAGAIV